MDALKEFINTCIDVSISECYQALRINSTSNQMIHQRLEALTKLRIKINCFEGTGEVISESSDSDKESENESSEKESTESSSSDSLNPLPTPPPISTGKVLPPFPTTGNPPKKVESDDSDSSDSSSDSQIGNKYRKTPFVVLRPILEKKEKGLYIKLWRLWDRIMRLKAPIFGHLKIAMSKAYAEVFVPLNKKSNTMDKFKQNIKEAFNQFRDIYNQMEDDYEDKEFKKKLLAQRKAFIELKDTVEAL